jgi:hypothetical protein
MSINIGLRREPKGDETYSVPDFVNRVNGYFNHAPAHLVEVEPGIEYPEGYVLPAQPDIPAMETVTEEVIEEAPGPKVHDNGLGILVVGYPEVAPIPESTSERNLYKTPVSYKKLAASGLGRIVKSAKVLPSVATQKLSANLVTGLSSWGEKFSLAEHKTSRKRLAVATLGGLAVAAMAYATYKGINLSGTSRSHEAVQPVVPIKTPNHVTEALQTHKGSASSALGPTVHHINKSAHAKTAADMVSRSFTIESGHGFTQELNESFSTKADRMTPLRSYHLFTALRQHFGDHGILKHGKGLVDGTYTQNGEEYISKPGRGQWAPGVVKFAHEWLKTHKT